MGSESAATNLTLPYKEVRQCLALTAQAAGCPKVVSEHIGQSAWHLTNRGLGGVCYAIRYIALLLKNPEIDRLALAALGYETAEMIGGTSRRGLSLKVPHAPLLVLPFASEILRNEAETDAVLFTFDDNSIVYSKSHGIRVLNGTLNEIEHVAYDYCPTCTASRIEYSDPADLGIDLGFQRRSQLEVPSVLYRGPGQPLDIDLIAHL